MKMKNFIAVLVLMAAGACNTASAPGSSGGGDGGSNGGGGDTTSGTPEAAAYSISGQITGASAADVTVALSGDAAVSTTTDEDGNYAFTGLAPGIYTVTPAKANTAFNPASASVTVADSDEEAGFASAAHQNAAIASSSSKDGTINECDGDSPANEMPPSGKVGREGSVGDCGDADRLYKTFFHFDLASAGISASATIVSAVLSFKQTVTGTPYSANPLTISHVNYGDALGTDDWDTTPITSQTIQSASSDSGVTVSADLKDYVQPDAGGRRQTQFRLSFPDGIADDNYITIERGSGAANPPALTITYYQF